MELSGKICLVTGASSGIGRATALALIERGAVVAASARREPELAALGAASVHPADLSDPANAIDLADDVLAAHGRVDVLLAIAGVRVDGAVADVALDDLDRSFQVNALAPFVLAGRLLPGMRERGEGVIALVAAPMVTGGRKGMGAYAASKAAVVPLAQTLRQEAGGGSGVAVFAWDPGYVKTELAPEGKDAPEDAAARLLERVAAGRSERDVVS